ncbi:SDR family NAD(P)-dependent oxidoreductase [Croceicoccus mobilis]|uniref:Short chain dehydrogenase n=1 Tax=Croceicoccus mobilis TaxID=1703339 RepID=A0A917DTI9_9SPHN|nr:SDR family oxidoreductase [Croceicoccus mobilis]GGD67510.1 short chain dehydrogenase [Croceicoccus mobilis]
MGDFDFTGKSALVTGAASGIGAACARALAARGAAHLLLVDRDAAALEAMDLACDTTLVSGDVSDPELWSDLSATIDLAVINAGVAGGPSPIATGDFAEWRRIMGVNLDGAFLSLSFAMRSMTGGGVAVITSSLSALRPYPGTAAYGASKAALIQLMKIAAAEGAEAGIRVNAIAPGPVDTAMWGDDAARAEMMAGVAAGTPLNRVASAEEIAGSVLYLLSDMAANATGTVLVSDGGSLIG